MALANTDKLTSQLAMLPDNALRQMAQMHKNDPYVLPLIIAEDGRRKQLRMAGQAQQYRPQPKVADAQAAQVGAPLPEEMGIGMLPTPNMAQMAGGGITGEEESQTMADGGTVAFHNGENVKRYSGEFGSFVTSAEDLALDELRRQALLRQRAEDARISALVEGRAVPSVQTEAPRVAAPVPATPAAPAAPTQRDEGGQKAPPSALNAARRVDAGAGAAPGQINLRNPAQMYEQILTSRRAEDPAKQALERLATKERAVAEAEKAAIERDQARFAEAYKGREERLAKREGEIESEKNTNTGLALLNAGLAIMSTPGGLAMAIGKGAQVGTAQFAAGLDKIRSAQDKLADARDRLDDLKLNRAEMDAKEIRAAEAKIRNVGLDAEKRTIDGIRQAAQVSRDEAARIYQGTIQIGVAQMESASRAAAANPQLNLIRALGEAKPGSALDVGYERYKQESLLPRMLADYTDKLSDPLKGAQFKAMYPTFETYRAAAASASGQGQILPGVPQNAPVRAP